MTEILAPPNVELALSSLKDFQRRTVDYVFRRLYLDDDPVRRFLIADEVGLGKTMVARGVVAKAIEHLWDKRERIDIVYVCSNADIARQNANRLMLPGVQAKVVPSRITLMPKTVKTLDRKLNFVSITPGTSFNLRSSSGTVEERALIYALLEAPWQFQGRDPAKVLAGYARFENFEWHVEYARGDDIDAKLGNDFVTAVEDQALRQRFHEICEQMHSIPSAGDVPYEIRRERDSLIGELRRRMASVCLKALEPDVVILDEFQRFRHLISKDDSGVAALDEMRDLAHEFMNHPDASVLMLSATPYKMYTLADEPTHDNHYADLRQTLAFLYGNDDTTGHVMELLDRYGQRLLTGDGDGLDAIGPLRRELEQRLLEVMVRTERLAVSADRDGMLQSRRCDRLDLTPRDLDDYLELQEIASALDQPDVMEYWKSSPYLLNFMESYEVKRRFERASEDVTQRDSIAGALARRPELLLDWNVVGCYGEIDAANPRLRSLIHTMLDDPLWQLLWVPPSLPYYQLSGPFATAAASGLTKRLVFSSWAVVPKTLAALLSYEAERRIIRSYDSEAENSPEARKRRAPLLRFARSQGRLTGMPVFALLYPSTTLAEICDPLLIGGGRPRDDVVRDVAAEIEVLLEQLPENAADDDQVDESWYWAAPLWLDLVMRPEATERWMLDTARLQPWGAEDGDDGGEDDDFVASADLSGSGHAAKRRPAFAEHIERVQRFVLGERRLGRRPPELSTVLARLALAGPGTTALRALSRITGGQNALGDGAVLTAAARIAWAYRDLFNIPEPMAIVRGIHEREDESLPYWRQVLRYGLDGCLQAVLDEYVHILRESQGLANKEVAEVVETVARVLAEVLTIRTASLSVDDPIVDETTLRVERRRLHAHFALRFGDERSETGQMLTRASSVREAFNSPFWPFVVTTTSVGQEGLDFHCYCHAVVHWNLPSNPVDLEQREGRVHRYKGHAVRKNLALRYGLGALSELMGDGLCDPWDHLFALGCRDRGPGQNDLVPFWVYPVNDGARIERYVPCLPLSRDSARLEALLKTLVVYRAAIGQPRQQDIVGRLLQQVPADQIAGVVDRMRIDLSPPATCTQADAATSKGG